MLKFLVTWWKMLVSLVKLIIERKIPPYELKWTWRYATGVRKGQATPIPDEFYAPLKQYCFGSIPVDIVIKFMGVKEGQTTDGHCGSRSLLMFLCYPEAVLVRATTEPLRKLRGKDQAYHGWIEMGGYVYDPSSLLRYEKDFYYKLQRPKVKRLITHEEYDNSWLAQEQGEDIYPISEYKPGGRFRDEILILAPMLIKRSEVDPEFKKAITEFLQEIEYDQGEDINFKRALYRKIMTISDQPLSANF